MMRGIIAVLVALGLMRGVWAASANCEEHAAEVSFKSAERTVTLVPEYDVDSGTSDAGRGVYYFKAKLERGMGYTVWTTGLSTNDDVSVIAYARDSDDDDEDGPSADFEEIEEPEGNTRLVLYSTDWYYDAEDKSESDPKSWTYIIQLEGEVGQEVNIHFQQGVIIPAGREENPVAITPSATGVKKHAATLQLDSTFYYRVNFKEGYLYWFATGGGTTNSLLSVDIDTPETAVESDNAEEETQSDFEIYPDANYDADPSNTGIWVVPNVSGYYNVIVSADGDDADGAAFSLSYRTYNQKKPADHASKELNAANNFTSDYVAGHMNSAASFAAGYYDKVVDDALFRFTAEKGKRYLVETLNAQTNMFLAIYDQKGTILNWNVGDGQTLNSRAAFAADANAVYYIGVCQNISDDFTEEPAYTTATVRVTDASTQEGVPDAFDPLDDTPAGATGLVPVPGHAGDRPEEVDTAGSAYHELGKTDWDDVFMIGGRKGLTYSLRVSYADPANAFNYLRADVFTMSGTREKAYPIDGGDINAVSPVPFTFTATANGTYYVRIHVQGGRGLDSPKYKVHAIAHAATGEALGILKVNTYGTASGGFSLDKETVKYPGGVSVLVSGTHTVKYAAVKGFSAPAAETVVVPSGKTPKVLERYYSDTFDPKDDTAKGATALAFKNVEATFERTFWKVDKEDNFVIAGKDGQYFDFALRNVTGDAVLSVTNAEFGTLVKNVPGVQHLLLPTSKAKYYVTVTHGGATPVDGSYLLAGLVANVGTLKLAKSALNVKEDAPSVVVTVNRTAKDGAVRVKYGTVAGTAKPGEDYVPQTGILEWANGDNKAKTITVKLIPDLVPVYEGDKTFAVELKELTEGERTAGEYPGQVVGGTTCTITLKETAKPGVTAADAYAKVQPKLATTKTEVAPLVSGSFFGVLAETDAALTNGLPALASVTLTVGAVEPAKLSAKVALAGKTYTFTGTGWDAAASDATWAVQTLTQVQKVNNVAYTNTLTLRLAQGATDAEADWAQALVTAELVMNVPDAKGKGVQANIRYAGTLGRNNAKIQNYLTAVTNFAGYYTVALASPAAVGDGVPAGHGYLTLTLDNKGTAKVAGMLADGSTKVSLSVAACPLVKDASSANGYALYVPLFMAKSPYCFGGTLRLFARALDGAVVVDSSALLQWNNDNAALTYANDAGYRLTLAPCGGWYDKVVNLQRYYLTRAFEVGAPAVEDFPPEMFAVGFTPVSGIGPKGDALDLSGNALTAPKQVLAKNGKLVDYAASVNPAGVQLKFARATGLVTGTFGLWTENGDASVQKQVKGLKFFGAALLVRDAASPLGEEVVAPGFFTQAVTLTEGAKSRKWTFSAPFNVLGVDLGDVNWWADDWGVQP